MEEDIEGHLLFAEEVCHIVECIKYVKLTFRFFNPAGTCIRRVHFIGHKEDNFYFKHIIQSSLALN